jgi:cephalosporin hydroxylase
VKIILWIRRKRLSKNILWKTVFLIIDFLRPVDHFKKNKYLEDNLNTPIKTLLIKIQKETFNSTYFGVPILKSPTDFWVYMEIVYEIKPDIIIEIGNYYGGSTLALAHMLDHIGKGRVIGIDINHDKIPKVVKEHPRITLLTGNAGNLFSKVQDFIGINQSVLIIEDSRHTYENTLKILRTYNTLVSRGSYFIVEDSIINHGLDFLNEFQSGGPFEAVEAFVKENDNFIIDRTKERFVITCNPKGYLKKK